ncbi:hypothetical protein B0H21DRAFT_164158 [Amylocystis lapponica]|nr:hypothetical protein B0H21DRAFT_164158 [Amylocystis lapponica]
MYCRVQTLSTTCQTDKHREAGDAPPRAATVFELNPPSCVYSPLQSSHMSSHNAAGHFPKTMVSPALTNSPIVQTPRCSKQLCCLSTKTRKMLCCLADSPQIKAFGQLLPVFRPQRPYIATPERPFSQTPSIYFRVNGRDGINLARALENNLRAWKDGTNLPFPPQK